MSQEKAKQFPYRSLGYRLRDIREKRKESISQVSDAVEIENQSLINIEDGSRLPEEDILLLLINHFKIKNDEALKIWQLAGYSNNLETMEQSDNGHQPTILVIPMDNKIIYSDLLQVSANNYGIVLNFMQTGQTKNKMPQFVSRIGISKEHANDIVKMLNQILETKNQKLLENKSKINKSKKP